MRKSWENHGNIYGNTCEFGWMVWERCGKLMEFLNRWSLGDLFFRWATVLWGRITSLENEWKWWLLGRSFQNWLSRMCPEVAIFHGKMIIGHKILFLFPLNSQTNPPLIWEFPQLAQMEAWNLLKVDVVSASDLKLEFDIRWPKPWFEFDRRTQGIHLSSREISTDV